MKWMSLCFVFQLLQWLGDSIDGALITSDNVFVLPENQKTPVTVVTATCTDGSDMVLAGTFTPTSLCTTCFVVEPSGVTDTYDVIFYPNSAAIDHESVPEYTVTLTCSDLDNSTNTDTHDVSVRIRPNTAPQFDDGLTDQQTVTNTKDVTAGTTLFTISDVTDHDGDAIYFTLTATDPVSSNFQVGYTDGVVSAVNDLNTQCTSEIDLSITITDLQDTTGPQVIDVTLQDYNQLPVIDNTDTVNYLDEDTTVGTTLMTLAYTDDTTNNEVRFETSPASAEDMFTLNANNELLLAEALDYEDTALRRILVLFTVDDGGCTSSTFTYTVSVTNVNEAPVISPEDDILDVYEGDMSVNPGWTTADPDLSDTLTYSITAATPTASALRFDIDSSTGVITSVSEYDVDQSAETATVTLTIQVSDAAGLTDSTTVILDIKDTNDNDPTFTTVDQYFTVTACSTVGSQLGSVAATDLDSTFQDNNVISFSKSSGSDAITVTSGGDIILSSLLTTGTSETITIVATDHGEYPSTLTSAVPATVTVAFLECTTTTSTTTTTTTTTTTSTTTVGTAVGKDDENVPWIIISALLGVGFVGLTTWLCMTRAMAFSASTKFAPGWVKSCQCGGKGLCQRRKPPPRLKVKPYKEASVKPQPASGNPEFWKERYANDNYGSRAPHRDALPEPANYEAAPSNNYHTYNSQQGIPQPDSYEKKDTARIWSDETVDPDYNAPNVPDRDAANNGYDTMGGIL